MKKSWDREIPFRFLFFFFVLPTKASFDMPIGRFIALSTRNFMIWSSGLTL